MQKPQHFAGASFFVVLFMGIILLFAVLKVASSVLIPLVIAILMSFVFEPLIETFNRKLHIPRTLSIFLVLSLCVVVVYFFGIMFFSCVKSIVSMYPKYEERFMLVYQEIAIFFKLPYDKEISLFENLWNQLGVRSVVQGLAVSFSSSTIKLLKDFLLLLLFTIFFLFELKDFKKKIECAFEGKFSEKVSSIIEDVTRQIAKYISVKFYISLMTGILVLVGTYLIGLDFFVMWGVLAFILNFIPNFGSIASGFLTCGFALIQFWPRPLPVILTIVLMLGVNLILGNLVEPRIQGRNLGLSPFVVIASLSVWGWIWGFSGLVLALPMMVIVKIICENVSYLKPVSILLGSYNDIEEKVLSENKKN